MFYILVNNIISISNIYEKHFLLLIFITGNSRSPTIQRVESRNDGESDDVTEER